MFKVGQILKIIPKCEPFFDKTWYRDVLRFGAVVVKNSDTEFVLKIPDGKSSKWTREIYTCYKNMYYAIDSEVKCRKR